MREIKYIFLIIYFKVINVSRGNENEIILNLKKTKQQVKYWVATQNKYVYHKYNLFKYICVCNYAAIEWWVTNIDLIGENTTNSYFREINFN